MMMMMMMIVVSSSRGLAKTGDYSVRSQQAEIETSVHCFLACLSEEGNIRAYSVQIE